MLMLVASSAASLFVAAGVAVAVIAWDVFRGRSVKLLTAGAALLFIALGGYLAFIDGTWSPTAVRLAVDGGTLAIALLSIAIRLPFTLQYARETVDAGTMQLPGFMTANYILTWVWAGAFLLMLAANILTIYQPGLPFGVGLGIGFAARSLALYFTRWYPQHRRAKFGGRIAADRAIPASQNRSFGAAS